GGYPGDPDIGSYLRSAAPRARLSRALLPDADEVAARVSDQRYPQVAFRIRGVHDLGALGYGPFQGLVEVLDEHVRPDPALAGYLVVGAEVADDVAGAVLERRVFAVAAHRPAEDGFVERSRGLWIRGRDPQVRDPAGP